MQGLPESAEETLRELAKATEGSLDPIRQLILYALGDVVALGLMTQEEFEEEAELDLDDEVVKMSGSARALLLIPVKERIACWKELASYLYPKKKPAEVPVNPNDQDGVLLYLPQTKRMDGIPLQGVSYEEPEKPKRKRRLKRDVD